MTKLEYSTPEQVHGFAAYTEASPLYAQRVEVVASSDELMRALIRVENTSYTSPNQWPNLRVDDGTGWTEFGSRSLLINAVAQIGGQTRQSPGRGFATPWVGMVKPRTPRAVMAGRSR